MSYDIDFVDTTTVSNFLRTAKLIFPIFKKNCFDFLFAVTYPEFFWVD